MLFLDVEHKEDTEENHRRLLRCRTQLRVHPESQQDLIPVVHPCIWTLFVLCERSASTSTNRCILYAFRCSTDFWRESWWRKSLSDCDKQRMERCCLVKGDCGYFLTQTQMAIDIPIRRFERVFPNLRCKFPRWDPVEGRGNFFLRQYGPTVIHPPPLCREPRIQDHTRYDPILCKQLHLQIRCSIFV